MADLLTLKAVHVVAGLYFVASFVGIKFLRVSLALKRLLAKESEKSC